VITDKDYIQAIASQIAGRKVAVTPFYGPVVPVINYIDETTGLNPALSPYLFGQWPSLGETFRYWYPYPIYWTDFEVWRVPVGLSIDFTQCNTVPVAFRTVQVAGTSLFNMNGGLIGGKQIIAVPKGATITDISNCDFLVRGSYLHYYNDWTGVSYFVNITDDVYIGRLISDPLRTNNNGNDLIDAQYARNGFVDIFKNPTKFISIYESSESYTVSTTTRTFKTFDDVQVYNAFAPAARSEDWFTGQNPVQAYSYFAPWVLGWKFKGKDSDVSPEKYLTEL